MPDGFLAIAAICRPRGATCWVLQVGLSFKLICHSAVEPRVTGRTKLARRKRGSYSYHINQTTVTLTRHRWPPHPPGTSSASHCADCQIPAHLGPCLCPFHSRCFVSVPVRVSFSFSSQRRPPNLAGLYLVPAHPGPCLCPFHSLCLVSVPVSFSF